MIKYLGSKRRLIPVLEVLFAASGAKTGLDLFTGTTRVAQAMKRTGLAATAVDLSRAAHVLAQCYVAFDPSAQPEVVEALGLALDELQLLPGRAGYVTETFCEQARFFRPENGERIDAIRDAIEARYARTALWPLVLTSLIEAADRVDSTTGVQMAYLKQWAGRSLRPLTLRIPEMVAGPGRALRGDASVLAGTDALGRVDLAYLDPPYNQHRYDANYHVWETLVAWDAPAHYGVACKRVDLREPDQRSVFNGRRTAPVALAEVMARLEAELVILSYNNESWLSFDELHALCAPRGEVAVLAVDAPRYVGARIGIHSPTGERVGTVSHLRNTEYVVLAGPTSRVRPMARAVVAAGLAEWIDRPVARGEVRPSAVRV